MSTYKYDIEDWKNGHIPRPKEIEDDQEKDSLVYWTFECDKPRISESEFKKIRELQKKVFFELIDLKAEALKEKFLIDIPLFMYSAEKRDIFHLEFQSLNNKLKDPYLLKRMKLNKWDRKMVTPEVYQAYDNYKSINEEIKAEELEIGENIFGSSALMYKKAKRDKHFRRFSEIETKGLFGTYVNHKYLNILKAQYLSEFGDDSELPGTVDSIVQEEHIRYGSNEVKVEELKRILNSGKSITEGKINFVNHIKNKFNLRTEKMAFEKASEIYSQIHEGHKRLYKDLSSYQSTKSQFLNRKLNGEG